MVTVTLLQALGMAWAHHNAGRLPEAEALYRQILIQQPGHDDALHLLGLLVGQAEAGTALIRQAITLVPPSAEYYGNLGYALLSLERFAEVAEAYRQALRLRPGIPQVHHNLGNALFSMGRLDEAAEA